LKFTGGYRYTWDYRSDYALRTTTNNSGQTTSLTNAASGTFQSPSWLMSANYQVDPNTLVYLSWRRGYKSGGFNTTSANPNFFFFKPEVVKTVELGIKSDWDIGGIKIRTDAAAYHNDYTRMQIAFADPTNANASLVVNGGKSQEDGFELEGKIIPISSLEISGAWNWEHAKYLQLIGPAGQNLSGTTFADVPTNKTNLNIRYFLPVDASWGSLSVAGNWAWQSHMLFDGNGGYDPLANIGSHSQFDLRLDWNEIFGEPIDASLFVTNLTDTVFRVGGLPVYPTALAYDGAYYNPPRMLGFSVKYRFGGPSEESTEPAAYTPPPAVAPAPAAAPRSYLVFFDFNKSDLTPQAQTIVDQAAHNAASAKVTQLTVTGHTDTVGSDAYNMRLSRRRAESVAAQLEKDGIPSSEIELVAKGKHDLLVPTGDGVREPQNRRVQIVYRDGMTSS
jgi:outer membrane protein OmpA-like peptidoglycan-associated protein